MLDDKIDDSWKENAKNNFDQHIPDIYIKQINETKETRKIHFDELKDIYCFYNLIQTSLPSHYLSKSGIRMGSPGDFLCNNPYSEGIIENTIIFLEKQFFDCLALLFNGTYRPIWMVLRYMLEHTTWACVSIIDKKALTGKKDDKFKAMSHIQFNAFLINNLKNMKCKKDTTIDKKIRDEIRPVQGIQKMPYLYMEHLRFKDFVGNNVIQFFYSELSQYAHANIFTPLRWDGRNIPTHIDDVGMFVGKTSYEGYHKSLQMISYIHEIIFHLLLVAAYDNIGYYQLKTANLFWDDIVLKLSRLKPQIRFTNIEKLLAERPKIIISDDQKDMTIDDDDDDDDYMSLYCLHCGYDMLIKGEECISCHISEYDVQEDWHNPII